MACCARLLGEAKILKDGNCGGYSNSWEQIISRRREIPTMLRLQNTEEPRAAISLGKQEMYVRKGKKPKLAVLNGDGRLGWV